MKTLARLALTIGAAALIAGCDAENGASAVPQGAVSQSRVHQASGSGGDLLYVATSFIADVLTYPGLEKVATLKPVGYEGHGTSDPTNGNVLFDNFAGVYIYAHGGSSPIASIDAPQVGDSSVDCAVDPTTDAIAVDWDARYYTTLVGWVGIYSTPSSNPVNYKVPNINNLYYLGYDGSGNLFVDGYGSGSGPMLAELPKGGKQFIDISLNKSLKWPGAIQWDGSYITVMSGITIDRIQVSGSAGTVVGQTVLKGLWGDPGLTSWIQGNTVIGPHLSPPRKHDGRYLGFWSYPAGGKAFKVLKSLSKNKKDRMNSVTVSVVPSRSRVRH